MCIAWKVETEEQGWYKVMRLDGVTTEGNAEVILDWLGPTEALQARQLG